MQAPVKERIEYAEETMRPFADQKIFKILAKAVPKKGDDIDDPLVWERRLAAVRPCIPDFLYGIEFKGSRLLSCVFRDLCHFCMLLLYAERRPRKGPF